MNKNQLKSLLQYKSNEMIPSTHLIRKSKQVFDSIQHNDIEKAIILRDGKPSFIMMDFKKYEEIINFFINENISIDKELDMIESINTNEVKESFTYKENTKDKNEDIKSKKDLLLEKLDSIEGVIKNDNIDIQDNLKDFWE